MNSKSTIRELIERQRQRLRSKSIKDWALGVLLHSGEVSSRLLELTDRQVGQLMFDHVGGELGIASPESAICNEATERLFRSSAGMRSPSEEMNDIDKLPSCPRCGEPMMYFVGVGEPDFRKCVSLACGYKVQERK